ncbi:BID domain-containing protein [Mesorhizobium sp. M1338]|uniref:BID domain-containing protein n=1 Tax=unclassified Mesorhizobium TaxID=325217 RepID=UPI003335506E
MHTHHWRAASSYVALTRQRESATIFVATQTARDLRQLARQLGRNEIKSASVAYATRDEFSAEQRAKLDEERAAENARPVSQVGKAHQSREQEEQPMASVVEEARVDMRQADPRTPEMQSGAIAKDAEGQRRPEHRGGTPEPVVAQKSKEAGGSDRPGSADDRVVASGTEDRQAVPNGRNEERSRSTAAGRPADVRVLIAAFQDVAAGGVRRDSLGRSIDEKSIAAAVSRDADVQREREARSIYLETAYRDPKSAAQRLDEIIARDGPTSAAQRISADTSLVGELRGREGFFAGARAREERTAAEQAAAAIGPNIVRTAEFENRAERSYRTQVEKQLKADAVEVRDVSDRAKAALEKIAMAKDDRERAEAFKAVSADQEVRREIATFKKSIEVRFGEDGAREIARATASGKSFEHPSVRKSDQVRLGEAAALYSAARSGEVASRQEAETERLAARESQSTRLKQ